MDLIYQAAGYALMVHQKHWARQWIAIDLHRIARSTNPVTLRANVDQLDRDIEAVIKDAKVYA